MPKHALFFNFSCIFIFLFAVVILKNHEKSRQTTALCCANPRQKTKKNKIRHGLIFQFWLEETKKKWGKKGDFVVFFSVICFVFCPYLGCSLTLWTPFIYLTKKRRSDEG